MLTAAQRLALLTRGRAAVAAALRGRPSPTPQEPGGDPGAPDPALAIPRGVFATWLTPDRQLRGCVGFPDPRFALSEAVARAAVEAALCDPRFLPVTSDELPALVLELSILTEPVVVHDPGQIQPGQHGVIVQVGDRTGLLLPQVARDHGWDRETFLDQACLKAGLPPHCWRHEARLMTFTAEVFGES